MLTVLDVLTRGALLAVVIVGAPAVVFAYWVELTRGR